MGRDDDDDEGGFAPLWYVWYRHDASTSRVTVEGQASSARLGYL